MIYKNKVLDVEYSKQFIPEVLIFPQEIHPIQIKILSNGLICTGYCDVVKGYCFGAMLNNIKRLVCEYSSVPGDSIHASITYKVSRWLTS